MSRAGKANLVIEQGATFSKTLTYKVKSTGDPIDLTGWSGRMKIKTSAGGTLIVSLTMGNGISIPTPANGQIIITITSAQTAAMTFGRGAVYDLEIYNSDDPPIVKKLLKGSVKLELEETD